MYGDDAKRAEDMAPSTTITLNRLADLLLAEEKLERLEAAGVDNWEGYDMSAQDGGESHYGYLVRVKAALRDGTLTPDFI